MDVLAQDPVVKYYYDASGNRYLRETIYVLLMPDSINLPDTINKDFLMEDELPSNNNDGQKTNIENCEIAVYPNPFENNFKVEINGITDEKNARLILHSVNGSQIKHLENLQQSTTIDASSLVSGTYFLTIYMKEEKATWKLVKK
jgi:hypothetical protein